MGFNSGFKVLNHFVLPG